MGVNGSFDRGNHSVRLGPASSGNNRFVTDFFDRIGVPPEKRALIIERINQVLSYEPKIGVFGKTGVGKSSLCNALFGQDLCKISDIASCTRNPQEVLLNLGANKGIILVDVPGVGESKERDKEYGGLYTSLLPKLDLILWVLKGDDRAFSSDEHFYKNIVKPHIDKCNKPFFFVLNQVDKIEPFREWKEAEHEPGVNQFYNIHKKVNAVSISFAYPENRIIPVSANENFNLNKLVDAFIFELPNKVKVSTARAIDAADTAAAPAVNPADDTEGHGRHISKKARKEVEKSFLEIVKENVVEIWEAGKERVERAWGKVKDFGKKVWDNTLGRCFITTATCETLGKPDNCYELNLFRDFRDNWLERQPDGKALIQEYYDVAPKIVNSINKRKDANIFTGLSGMTICPLACK